MKHIRLLLLFAILISFVTITITMAQSAEATSGYFPLQIGNQWSYTSLFYYVTQTITDTARIHGHLYYRMSGNTSSSSTWFRTSHDSVFVMKHLTDSSESPLYYLNGNVGDTIKLLPGYGCTFGTKTILAGKEDTVSSFFRTYFHCYHFKHITGCIDGGMYDSWLAKDVGLVQYQQEDFNGLFTYNLDSSTILTSIKSTTADANITSYLLFDNYPNPFNPQTTLSYRIKKSSHVTLAIFDLTGKEIVQLVNQQQALGNYHISWNAEGMPSGVYFAILRTSDFSITRKLILEK